MIENIEWSWPEHPYEYRVRLGSFVISKKRFNIKIWTQLNFNQNDLLTFHGHFNDFYFKNEEDAVAFKLRWI